MSTIAPETQRISLGGALKTDGWARSLSIGAWLLRPALCAQIETPFSDYPRSLGFLYVWRGVAERGSMGYPNQGLRQPVGESMNALRKCVKGSIKDTEGR